MTQIANTLSNILIKHYDPWGHVFYLTSNLIFTTDRSQAAKFYFSKSDNTAIHNGDRVNIRYAAANLIVNKSNIVQLVEYRNPHFYLDNYVIGTNSEEPESITADSLICLISDKPNKLALKLKYHPEIINKSGNKEFPAELINDTYENIQDINEFHFKLENDDNPTSNKLQNGSTKKSAEGLFDGYKGLFLIILIIIVLILCVIINRIFS